MNTSLQIVNISIEKIKNYENNARKNDGAIEAVKASIREFGFKIPCIVDKENVLVCGHTRVRAARELGLESVPCIVADDLTPEQIKAFRLVDNKTAELSDWDFDKLKIELDELALCFDELNFEDFGFDEADLLPDDMELDREDRGQTKNIPHLKYGTLHIQMTDDENERFKAALDRYIHDQGSTFGFVSQLLEGAMK